MAAAGSPICIFWWMCPVRIPFCLFASLGPSTQRLKGEILLTTLLFVMVLPSHSTLGDRGGEIEN